ncbi:General alpha-glucoside permease [Apiospora hydei]|uniref:General alpha-glucoside permease n=1 Tax=Apiospora hydei TaxID=1337664 RepID=A0ABR1V1K9_9PEZI
MFQHTSSIQPIFQALEVTRPECRFDSVDVVMSHMVLTRLLLFCGVAAAPFRINASLIHDSLVLKYCPERVQPERASLGLQFEEATSSYPKGLEDSHNHWRVLRYRLGPLKRVVYYEADATTEPYACVLSVASGLGSAGDSGIPAREGSSAAVVVVRGHLTDQEHAVEIKCTERPYGRSPRNSKLWAGCVNHLLLGRLADGEIIWTRMVDVRQRVAQWSRVHDKQEALSRLPALISELKDAVRATPNGRAALVFRGVGLGEVRAEVEAEVDVYSLGQDEGCVISRAMTNKFWNASGRKKAQGRGR